MLLAATQRRSLLLLLLLALAGCNRSSSEHAEITLATTTSTRDSGLLDELLPRFRAATGIDVKVVAVGTGQAIELGRRGDADVLLTHARDLERQFVHEGHGERRIPVMANDFVLLGPASDPAHVRDAANAVEAMRRVARRHARFVSRGDRSGTHIKERALWDAAGVAPGSPWYFEAGQGMAGTLRVASEKRAYTLSDRSTYLAQRKVLDLDILFQGDERLRNEYAVIVVSRAKHPHVQAEAARRFAAFLQEDKTQRFIARFGIDTFGQQLFYPHHTGTNEPTERDEPNPADRAGRGT